MSLETTQKSKFAISPLTWSNDDLPEIGGDTPLEVCLSEMREAGFIATEMGVKYPREPEALKSVLGQHDLQLASGWYSGGLMARSLEEEIEAVQSHLTLLKTLGCTVMVVGEVSNTVHGDISVPLSARVILSDEEWKEFGRKLTGLADYLESQGVSMGYHHHVGTIIETKEDIERLISVTGPSVKFTIDTGHLTFAGCDPVELIKAYPDRISHVHLKDIRQDVMDACRAENWSFLEAVLQGVFTVPGDGCIDFPAVFEALKDAGYDGWFVVEAEQDPKLATPMEYAQMARQNIDQYASAAGF